MTELPLSISAVTRDGICVRMLERGTAVPASATRVFTTGKFLPSAVMAEIVLGERTWAKDNKRLKKVRVGGIKKSAAGIARISLKTEVLEDGTLLIELFDLGSHHKSRKKIRAEKWIPEAETVDAAIKAAEEHFEDDRRIDANSRIEGKARKTILIVDSLKRADRKLLSESEWTDVRGKTKDLKKRIRVKPSDLSDVDAKIIQEEIAGIQKILEKIDSSAK